MPSTLVPTAEPRDLTDDLREADRRYLRDECDHVVARAHQALRPLPSSNPSRWVEDHIIFDEPQNRGRFSFGGREYLRELVDWWGDRFSTDAVGVFGSQSGKSASILAGLAWTVCNLSAQIFWVMPVRDLAKRISNARWRPMLARSFPDIIPRGRDRHHWATFTQALLQANIEIVWSNSESKLSEVPATHAVMDEVDKFNEGGKGSADAIALAEERTKNARFPKRWKTSTPTLVEGLIWQEFLKTDRRRRFAPCPLCSKRIVLVWSKEYTVFPITGEEAPVVWDREAKRKDGTWDFDRVARSARFQCPHCGGHIRDEMKERMDAAATWVPTNPLGARGMKGWHLPSLWSPSPECSVGRLAVKFLNRKNSLLGLQSFINGDLAEPYQAQDTLGERVEAVQQRVEITAQWTKMLTVDCQAKAPYFWHIVRAWDGANSVGVAGGPLDTWDDIEDVQTAHGIKPELVAIDSGWGARSDADVYKSCAAHSEFEVCTVARRGGLSQEVLVGFGWLPCKGFPGNKRWKEPETGQAIPWRLQAVDPFRGTAEGGKCSITLLEHSDDFFEDILHELRHGERPDQTWKVSGELNSDAEYWRHMDGHVKRTTRLKNGRVVAAWEARAKTWPDHLLDCERLQIVLAVFYKFFPIDV
jgi:hypothetical protein